MDDVKVFQSWCQNCIWAWHPVMLSGYFLTAKCDKCGRYSDLAMVRTDNYAKPEPQVCIAGESADMTGQCGDPECVCAPESKSLGT